MQRLRHDVCSVRGLNIPLPRITLLFLTVKLLEFRIIHVAPFARRSQFLPSAKPVFLAIVRRLGSQMAIEAWQHEQAADHEPCGHLGDAKTTCLQLYVRKVLIFEQQDRPDQAENGEDDCPVQLR